MCNVLNKVHDTWPLVHDHPYCDLSKVLCASIGVALQDHNYFRLKHLKETFGIPEEQGFTCAQPLPKYFCETCNFRTNYFTLLIHHIYDFERNYTLKQNRQYLEKTYSCGKCGFQSYSRLHFLKHFLAKTCSKVKKSKANKKFGSVKCLSYGKTLPSKKLSRKKYKYHKTCPSFVSKEDKDKLKNEEKNCESVSIQWFQCARCPFKATRQLDVTKHLCLNKQKTEPLWFKCPNCPFQARSRDQVTRHFNTELPLIIASGFKKVKKLEPAKVEWFQCSQCCYKVAKSSELGKHCCVKNLKTLEIDPLADIKKKSKKRGKTGLLRTLLTH